MNKIQQLQELNLCADYIIKLNQIIREISDDSNLLDELDNGDHSDDRSEEVKKFKELLMGLYDTYKDALSLMNLISGAALA